MQASCNSEDWVSFVDNRTNYAEEMPAETPSQRDGLLIDASKRKRGRVEFETVLSNMQTFAAQLSYFVTEVG